MNLKKYIFAKFLAAVFTMILLLSGCNEGTSSKTQSTQSITTQSTTITMSSAVATTPDVESTGTEAALEADEKDKIDKFVTGVIGSIDAYDVTHRFNLSNVPDDALAEAGYNMAIASGNDASNGIKKSIVDKAVMDCFGMSIKAPESLNAILVTLKDGVYFAKGIGPRYFPSFTLSKVYKLGDDYYKLIYDVKYDRTATDYGVESGTTTVVIKSVASSQYGYNLIAYQSKKVAVSGASIAQPLN